MNTITLTYTKTIGCKMAYNQFTCREISDIDDLVDDANTEIIKLKREIKCLRRIYQSSQKLLNNYEKCHQNQHNPATVQWQYLNALRDDVIGYDKFNKD